MTKAKSLFRFAPWVVLIIAIVNLGYFWLLYHPTVAYTDFAAEPPVASYLNTIKHGNIYSYISHGRWFNEYTENGSKNPKRFLDLRNELIPNSNLLYEIPETMFYAALYPRRLGYMASLFENSYSLDSTSSGMIDVTLLKVLSMRNTTHIISPIELNNTELSLVNKIPLPSFDTKQFNFIYKNNDVLPKYYVVNSSVTVRTVEDLISTLKSDTFSINNQVILEEPSSFHVTNSPITISVDVKVENATDIQLKTETDKDGILVVANTIYPGWEAFLDGNKVRLFPANLVNMGIYLPKGIHTVELKYTPKSVYAGLYITIFGYLIFLCYISIIIWRFLRRK